MDRLPDYGAVSKDRACLPLPDFSLETFAYVNCVYAVFVFVVCILYLVGCKRHENLIGVCQALLCA